MKKVFALILALVMVFSLAGIAFAETTTLDNRNPEYTGVGEGAVKVEYNPSTAGGIVYYVVINWGNLTFTYQQSDAGTWDPDTHTYSNGKAAGWVAGANQSVGDEGAYVTASFSVENHSNADVQVTAAVVNPAENGTASLSVSRATGDDDVLVSAVNAYGNFDGADAAMYTVKMSGVPVEDTAAFAKITVTISAAP